MNEETKDIISEEIRKQLKADFPSEAYSQHPTKTYLTTLKAMYITERLNDVFGLGRWTLEHEVIKEAEGQVLIKGKLVIFDYECILPTQYGSHAITGTGVDLADGYKSAITDCISKSASYLEIGIDMFKGKISTSKGTTTTQTGKTQTTKPKAEDGGSKTLTSSEVEKKWNGKIYSGKNVFIDNVKFEITSEQIEKLKSHPKYKKE